MKIYDNKLNEIDFVASPNHGGEISPSVIVMHYTAGHSLASTVRWFEKIGAKASSHLVVGRDGGIVQMVPFNIRAWHAGHSKLDGKSNVNNFSIGIEVCNWGKLEWQDGSFYSYAGVVINDEDVVTLPHKFNPKKELYWEKFPEKQIEACVNVCKIICDHYKISKIVGHDDIADPKGRKVDPGPAFYLDDFKERVLGKKIESEDDMDLDTEMGEKLLRIKTSLVESLKYIDELLDKRD
jgi:N-acetylmuramoyl-L-alanine amidase